MRRSPRKGSPKRIRAIVPPKGEVRLFVRSYGRFAEDVCWPHHFVKLRALAKGFDGAGGKAPPGDKGPLDRHRTAARHVALRFGFRTVPELEVNEVALLRYVSDEYAARGKAEQNRVWFDDVLVATEYIGPKVDAKAK